jgi:glutaredoxin-like YruB-family protein
MKKVAIYTTPTCTYCRMAKEYFKQKGVHYEEHNVAADTERRQEMIMKSGQMGVPVIAIEAENGKEDIVIGFDETMLAQLLGV